MLSNSCCNGFDRFLYRVAEDELLQVVIISLLENMLSKVQLIAAIAYQQVRLQRIISGSFRDIVSKGMKIFTFITGNKKFAMLRCLHVGGMLIFL